MLYFITENYLKTNTPITANVDVTDVTPYIATQAQLRVMPILGTTFFNYMLNVYNTQTATNDEETLIKFIQPIVAWRSAEDAVFGLTYQLKNKEAVREMVKHYQDENVGAVAGEKRIVSKEKDSAPAAGEGFYWKYESHLKKLDSELHSVVGGAGELISFRSDLFQPLEEDTLLDDFVQSMRITLKGFRVVYEPNAYAEERASATVKEELKRKVRISAGAWQAMSRLGKAFNPFHNFIIVFSFISHKVLRWTLAPLSLLIIIPTNYTLS